MLPIRMGILEVPSGDSGTNGRRPPERLTQCLGCGALLWSRQSGDEPECRCTIAGTMREVAREPQLAPSAA